MSDEDERRRLVALLRSLGASDEELAGAEHVESVGGLALDLALRPPGGSVPFDEAARSADIDLGEAADVWRALGFPDPLTDSAGVRLARDEVEALTLLASTTPAILGSENVLALARVLGSSTSRLAEAIVDTFRSAFEHPRRTAGAPYSQVVEEYAEMARSMLPPFLELFGAVLRRHLVSVAAGSWSFDESATTRRELAVGFCDLVGYTALSGQATAAELARLVSHFDDVVGDVASRHRGRVVKLIGDGAMFVCENPEDACRLGAALIREIEGAPGLPPARVALAFGSVVAVHGDYYGQVVNLAARLLTVGGPGTVLVAESLEGAARQAGFDAVRLPPQSLKGFGSPATAFRVWPPG